MSHCPAALAVPVEVDVFLRGERDYVQGTQLIARASAFLAEEGAHLSQATFHRITSHRVALQLLSAVVPGDEVIGQVQFDGAHAVSGLAFLELPQPAPRTSAGMGVVIEGSEFEAPLHGVYRFALEIGDLESVLNVLVQSIKALHERLDPGVHDVWFTGMRRFPLPVRGWPELRQGEVHIMRRRVGRSGHQYQSMVEAVLKDGSGAELCRGFVNFAFKSSRVLDVH
jgi:hypothetical protein